MHICRSRLLSANRTRNGIYLAKGAPIADGSRLLQIKFLQLHCSMLADGAVAGVDERHGPQVFAPAGLRLGTLFERAEQLGHRTRKRVGKPHLVPTRLLPRVAE